jgi:hypothetical protein
MLPDPFRHFDRDVPVAGWASSDRYDEQLSAVLPFLDGHDDDGRPVLASLVVPSAASRCQR